MTMKTNPKLNKEILKKLLTEITKDSKDIKEMPVHLMVSDIGKLSTAKIELLGGVPIIFLNKGDSLFIKENSLTKGDTH